MKSPVSATITIHSRPPTQRGREKDKKGMINIQMYETHIDHKRMLNSLQDWKKQGKTLHEAPRGKKHKDTHNKNYTSTTALERSVA